MKKIAVSLKTTLSNIHQRGIAVLDFQPMNILISNDLSATLIDFETAASIDEPLRRGVGTPGYVPKEDMSPADNDWFAFNVVVINMLFPLVPMNAITEILLRVQIAYARKLFGEDADVLIELQKTDLPGGLEHKVTSFYNEKTRQSNYDELYNQLVQGIRTGIKLVSAGEHVHSHRRLPGDIFGFNIFGSMSLGCGLGGAVDIAISKEDFAKQLQAWIYQNKKPIPRGYLNGVDGISCVLHRDLVSELNLPALPELIRDTRQESIDCSIRTGLAGILLCRIALIRTDICESKRVLEEIKGIADLLSQVVENYGRGLVSPHATSRNPKGLFDGLLGVAIALLKTGDLLRNDHYKTVAIHAASIACEDLQLAADGSIQVKDNNRLMPYLAEGSAGFIYSTVLCQELRNIVFKKFPIEQFLQACEVRCTVNGGLFLGRSGLLLSRAAATHLLDRNPPEFNQFCDEIMPYLFQLNNEQGAFMAGQGGLRLSCDFSTGNIGVIKAMEVIYGKNSWWNLLPGLSILGNDSAERNLSS